MAIASAVVVPVKKEFEAGSRERLNGLREVEVKDVGERGVAVVLETEDVKRIKEVSEEISGWEEVIDFQLVHFNGEDMTGNDDQKGDGP